MIFRSRILTYDMRRMPTGVIVDMPDRSAQAYDTLLFEIYAAYVKMGLRDFWEQMYKVFRQRWSSCLGKLWDTM